MKFGLLFSGQGGQKSGMGLDFMVDPLFKETIDEASEASGQNIITSFKNEHNELKKTIYVQPALVAFEAGIYRMLKRDLPNLKVAGMIGLSLGEYSAMFASDALNLTRCINLVTDRAKYMQIDADKVNGGMIALLKPDLNKVKDILADLQKKGKKVYIANFNSPQQIVIGGIKEDVILAGDKLKENQAAKKIIILRVNGAFHTSLFNSAKVKMHQRLKQVKFNTSSVPVISNTTVKPFTNDWTEIMERQLAVPTHFGKCIQLLANTKQITATLEIGPGKVLSSFAKQTNRTLKNYHISIYNEYQKFIEEENEN